MSLLFVQTCEYLLQFWHLFWADCSDTSSQLGGEGSDLGTGPGHWRVPSSVSTDCLTRSLSSAPGLLCLQDFIPFSGSLFSRGFFVHLLVVFQQSYSYFYFIFYFILYGFFWRNKQSDYCKWFLLFPRVKSFLVLNIFFPIVLSVFWKKHVLIQVHR